MYVSTYQPESIRALCSRGRGWVLDAGDSTQVLVGMDMQGEAAVRETKCRRGVDEYDGEQVVSRRSEYGGG